MSLQETSSRFSRRTPRLLRRQLILVLTQQYLAGDIGGSEVMSCVPSIQRFHGALLQVEILTLPVLAVFSDAEGQKKLLIEYFSTILDIVERHGGDIVKASDGVILVVWESSTTLTEHGAKAELASVSKAASCAQEISAQVGGLKAQEGGVTLTVRLSISCGLMAGIDIGADDRWEFFLIGEPLSRVAEAKGLAAGGGVVLCPDSHALLHPGADATKIARLLSNMKQSLVHTGPGTLGGRLTCGCSFHPTGHCTLAPTAVPLRIEVPLDHSDVFSDDLAIIKSEIEEAFHSYRSLSAEKVALSDFSLWAQRRLADDLARHVHPEVRVEHSLFEGLRCGIAVHGDLLNGRLTNSPAAHRQSPSLRCSPSPGRLAPLRDWGHASPSASPSRSRTASPLALPPLVVHSPLPPLSSCATPATTSRNLWSHNEDEVDEPLLTVHQLSPLRLPRTPSRSVSPTMRTRAASHDSCPAVLPALVVHHRSLSRPGSPALASSPVVSRSPSVDGDHRDSPIGSRCVSPSDSLLRSALCRPVSSSHAETSVRRALLSGGASALLRSSLAHNISPPRPTAEARDVSVVSIRIELPGVKLLEDNTGRQKLYGGFGLLGRTANERCADELLLGRFQGILESVHKAITCFGGQLQHMRMVDRSTAVCVGTFGLHSGIGDDNHSTGSLEAARTIVTSLHSQGLRCSAGIALGSAIGLSVGSHFVSVGPAVELSAHLMHKACEVGMLCDLATRQHDRTHEFMPLTVEAVGFAPPLEAFVPVFPETVSTPQTSAASTIGAPIIRVEEAICHRFQCLGGSAQSLLKLAAVACSNGLQVPLELLRGLDDSELLLRDHNRKGVEQNRAELAEALTSLLDSEGFLVSVACLDSQAKAMDTSQDTNQWFEFVTPLEQQTVYGLLTEDQRHSTHERIATFLHARACERAGGATAINLAAEAHHWQSACVFGRAMTSYFRAYQAESGDAELRSGWLNRAYSIYQQRKDSTQSSPGPVGITCGDLRALLNAAFHHDGKPTARSGSTTSAVFMAERVNQIFEGDSDLLVTGLEMLLAVADERIRRCEDVHRTQQILEDAVQYVLLTRVSRLTVVKPVKPLTAVPKGDFNHFHLPDFSPVCFRVLSAYVLCVAQWLHSSDDACAKARLVASQAVALARSSVESKHHLIQALCCQCLLLFSVGDASAALDLVGELSPAEAEQQSALLIHTYGCDIAPLVYITTASDLLLSGNSDRLADSMLQVCQRFVRSSYHALSVAHCVLPLIAHLSHRGKHREAWEALTAYDALAKRDGCLLGDALLPRSVVQLLFEWLSLRIEASKPAKAKQHVAPVRGDKQLSTSAASLGTSALTHLQCDVELALADYCVLSAMDASVDSAECCHSCRQHLTNVVRSEASGVSQHFFNTARAVRIALDIVPRVPESSRPACLTELRGVFTASFLSDMKKEAEQCSLDALGGGLEMLHHLLHDPHKGGVGHRLSNYFLY